jgi:hypothetical protein
MNDVISKEALQIELLKQNVENLEKKVIDAECKAKEIRAEAAVFEDAVKNWQADIDRRFRTGKGLVFGFLIALGSTGLATFDALRNKIIGLLS